MASTLLFNKTLSHESGAVGLLGEYVGSVSVSRDRRRLVIGDSGGRAGVVGLLRSALLRIELFERLLGHLIRVLVVLEGLLLVFG